MYFNIKVIYARNVDIKKWIKLEYNILADKLTWKLSSILLLS